MWLLLKAIRINFCVVKIDSNQNHKLFPQTQFAQRHTHTPCPNAKWKKWQRIREKRKGDGKAEEEKDLEIERNRVRPTIVAHML